MFVVRTPFVAVVVIVVVVVVVILVIGFAVVAGVVVVVVTVVSVIVSVVGRRVVPTTGSLLMRELDVSGGVVVTLTILLEVVWLSAVEEKDAGVGRDEM